MTAQTPRKSLSQRQSILSPCSRDRDPVSALSGLIHALVQQAEIEVKLGKGS